MQLSKKNLLGLMVLTLLFWFVPFVESVNRDARSMQDLSTLSKTLLVLGMLCFLVIIHPLFLWMFHWLKKWINGQ